MSSDLNKKKAKTRNIVGICVCSALIIFAFCGKYFTTFFRDIANFFLGSFGMAFYGLMAAIIVACSFSLAGKKIKIPAKYAAHFVLLFVFVVFLVHLISMRTLFAGSGVEYNLENYAYYVYNYYDGIPTFGGIVFGIVTFALEKAMTFLGELILLLGVIIFDVIMIGIFFFNYFTGRLELESQREDIYDDIPNEAPAEADTTPLANNDDARRQAVSFLFDQDAPTVYPESVCGIPVAQQTYHFDTAQQSVVDNQSTIDIGQAESILFADSLTTPDQGKQSANNFFGNQPQGQRQTYFEDTQPASQDEFVVRGYYSNEQSAPPVDATDLFAVPPTTPAQSSYSPSPSPIDLTDVVDMQADVQSDPTPVDTSSVTPKKSTDEVFLADQGYWQPTAPKATKPIEEDYALQEDVFVPSPVATEPKVDEVVSQPYSQNATDSYTSAGNSFFSNDRYENAPVQTEDESQNRFDPYESVSNAAEDYSSTVMDEQPLPVAEPEEDDDEIVPIEHEVPVDGGMQVKLDFVTKKDLKEQQSKLHQYVKYNKPPFDLLNDVTITQDLDAGDRKAAAQAIVDKLSVFNIKIEVDDIVVGPSVTRYMFKVLSQKTRMGDFKQYADDIKACIEAQDDIRIEAPVHGTNLVGIEVANKTKSPVVLRGLLESRAFQQAKGNLVFAIGQEITGRVICADLSDMPHLLIAGTTGSGKSVCLNCLIVSIIYRYGPEYVRFLMVDPKYVELSRYNGIPHMLTAESITNVTDALAGMDYLINEMEARYQLFRQSHVGNITEYNARVNTKIASKMPYLIFVVDELADLMSAKKKDFEAKLGRLAQKSRAAGIHIVLATQRPDVNVITGTIKANLPCRMALKVASQYDSSTIIGCGGAEKLLGKGDMLFMNAGSSDLERIQGAYISNDEINNLVKFSIEQNEVYYDAQVSDEIFVSKKMEEEAAMEAAAQKNPQNAKETSIDPLCKRALRFWLEKNAGKASIASIQRNLGIGFNRAGRIMDTLQKLHYVEEPSASESGSKPLMVLVTLDQLDSLFPDLED